MNIKGKLVEIFDTVQVTETFKKRCLRSNDTNPQKTSTEVTHPNNKPSTRSPKIEKTNSALKLTKTKRNSNFTYKNQNRTKSNEKNLKNPKERLKPIGKKRRFHAR